MHENRSGRLFGMQHGTHMGTACHSVDPADEAAQIPAGHCGLSVPISWCVTEGQEALFSFCLACAFADASIAVGRRGVGALGNLRGNTHGRFRDPF